MKPVDSETRHHRACYALALLLAVNLLILMLLICPSRAYAGAAVLPGIDVLAARNFDILRGLRVGLITNHTGRSRDGRSSIDILHRAPGVRLVALFSPEHGIRGTEDEKITSTIDLTTGLQIHSLYGASCRPTPEMLRGVDILLFDIQDIGTRFYTYIGTLSLAMEAAGKAGIPFVVLDRPNPIGGIAVAGAMPSKTLPEKSSGCGAITSIHPIPTRHGMTVGELARLFNAEFGVTCTLTVVPMQGWRRDMFLDETGLAWINPSPNMKSLDAALLYPGLGILETTNLSVGRGTARPFQLYGAPWLDAAALLANLERRNIPGLNFSRRSFVPPAAGHPYKGKRCDGVSVTIVGREKLDPVLAGLHLLQAIFETHPKQFSSRAGFATELGDKDAWALLTAGLLNPEKVSGRWESGLAAFRKVRERHLIY